MLPSQSDVIRQVIENANRRLEAALRSGNTSSIATLYTDDAQLLPPASDPVIGSAGIADFWSLVIGMGIRDIVIQTQEIDAQGGTAIELGRFTLYGDAKTELDHGRYMVIWKLVKGEWKLHRDIWNSSLVVKN